VSITLARGAQRMAAAQVIVRRLNSIENFGSMNVLCSDKTGTLTEGVVRAAYAKVDEVPYDFVRKRLSVVVERTGAPEGAGRHTMITKGALRNVLEVCADAERGGAAETGARRALLAEVAPEIEERFEAWSEQGYRVLGVAVRDVTGDLVIDKDDEREMTFVGFLLFEDPPKAGAPRRSRSSATSACASRSSPATTA
jgi:Mg2+-importing ATPase